MADLMKALRHPRRAALFALLGRDRYRRLMADSEASSRAEWLEGQVNGTEDVATQFHLLSFYSGALQQTYWLGTPILKSPLDCWIYQEIIHELRPDLIIETGTDLGGSALFFASICDAVGHGSVISIDVRADAQVVHPRITLIVGDSVSPQVLDQVRSRITTGTTTLVILDSDHHAQHVRRELAAYHGFVTPGSYIVVEDTNVNGHPVMPEHGPGPFEAVLDFLSDHPDFQIDKSREKFLMTYFPSGFLKRVAGSELRSDGLARPTSQ